MVTIQSGTHQATFENGRWTSADPQFAAYLNAMLRLDDVSPAFGNPEVFIARDAVRRLGGNAKIINFKVLTLPVDAIP
jgi:hypothetical protein